MISMVGITKSLIALESARTLQRLNRLMTLPVLVESDDTAVLPKSYVGPFLGYWNLKCTILVHLRRLVQRSDPDG